MENSKTFDFDRFMFYLESVFDKMPPYGRPRAFIDNFKQKNPLPFHFHKKSAFLPDIRKSRAEAGSSTWRAKPNLTGHSQNSDNEYESEI
jgi:hypothetical protein